MKCPNCHTVNEASASFCENCGTPLAAPPPAFASENRTVSLGAPAPGSSPQGRLAFLRSWRGMLVLGLLALGLAAAVWLFLFSDSRLYGDDEDTMYRANARRTAEYDGGGILPAGREKWSASVMHEPAGLILESGGNIYVSTMKEGSSSTRTSSTTRTGRDQITGNIYAYSAEDGTRVNSIKSDGRVQIILAISDGVGYVFSSKGGDDWKLIALELESGEEKWDYSDSDDPDLEDLVIANETIYMVVDSNDRDGGSYIIAIDALTGDERWKYETRLEANTVSATDDVVYFTAFKHGDGDETEGCLFALDAESGRELWKFEKDMSMEGVVAGDDAVYVQAYDYQYDGDELKHDSHIYAVDAKSGNEKWDYQSDLELTEVALADGVIFVSENGGYYTDEDVSYLQAVDAGTGQKLWKYDHGTGGLQAPIVADGVVYVMGGEEGDEDNRYKYQLIALDAKSGSRNWKYDLRGSLGGGPIISEGKIFFLNCSEDDDDDCDLVALE